MEDAKDKALRLFIGTINATGGIDSRSLAPEHLARIPREGWVFLHKRDYPTPESVATRVEEIKVVCAAIQKAFPAEAYKILPTLRGGGDHYSFVRWGMYVGVEPDGYIHT